MGNLPSIFCPESPIRSILGAFHLYEQPVVRDPMDMITLPNCVIINHVLPFVDRSTWDNLVVANREIYQASREIKENAPWPEGELTGVGFQGDKIRQLCFSVDREYLCVVSENRELRQQRIRIWQKVTGSYRRIELAEHELSHPGADMPVWRVNFSPDEDILGLNLVAESDARLVKAIFLFDDEEFGFVGSMGDGRFIYAGVEDEFINSFSSTIHLLRMKRVTGSALPEVRHGLVGGHFEEVCQGETVSNIAFFRPLENSFAIMTPGGVIKLVRRAQDRTWTVEIVADGKCFDTRNLSFTTKGKLLATVRVDEGVEIWDPIKAECLRTVVCDQPSMLEFSPDGRLLVATSSDSSRLLLFNI
jgi:WD40 repeat protein